MEVGLDFVESVGVVIDLVFVASDDINGLAEVLEFTHKSILVAGRFFFGGNVANLLTEFLLDYGGYLFLDGDFHEGFESLEIFFGEGHGNSKP